MTLIIDYGAGNLGSLKNLLDRIGSESYISDKTEDVSNAKAIILPGVGAAGYGMANLKKKGLDTALKKAALSGKPLLGICLGMQLLFESSSEGNVKCLGLIEGKVDKFRSMEKVPQIGWNSVDQKRKDDIFEGIENREYFYFVNSYYCTPSDSDVVMAETVYGETFASVIKKNNIVGTQFHPEKSGKAGERLIKNFINTYL